MLGGLTPAEFVRGYWQKRPLLIRNAFPGIKPLVSRARLFALTRLEDVESRLVMRDGRRGRSRWSVAHGPFGRSAFPPVEQPRWTVLVQGVDLHDDAAHALLAAFRFLPDARLDDLMISWASDGGGVGPHVDSYDVFLLQVQGRRRWRIGRQRDTALVAGAPLKLLKRFAPDEEHVLEPGDMLYLPPAWAHDGTAVGGDCMTYSIGFRAPRRNALAAELVQHLTQHATDDLLYADERAAATTQPARLPRTLQEFAQNAVRTLSERPAETSCALGEILTEVKPGVLFDEPAGRWANGAVVLDRRTRMLYDERHVFINGDSIRATGEDARLMRTLADHRGLDARAVRAASAAARTLLAQWFRAGWLHAAAGVEAERGVDHAAADPDTDADTDPANGHPSRA
jgi:50S ribosomal protein L16 3-hydroxylase